MDNAEAITILAKMKRKFETELPKWYETATDSEKEEFFLKNREKIEALGVAIRCIQGFKKLETVNEFLSTLLNGENSNE